MHLDQEKRSVEDIIVFGPEEARVIETERRLRSERSSVPTLDDLVKSIERKLVFTSGKYPTVVGSPFVHLVKVNGEKIQSKISNTEEDIKASYHDQKMKISEWMLFD